LQIITYFTIIILIFGVILKASLIYYIIYYYYYSYPVKTLWVYAGDYLYVCIGELYNISNVKNVDKYGTKALMFNYKRESYYINNLGDP